MFGALSQTQRSLENMFQKPQSCQFFKHFVHQPGRELGCSGYENRMQDTTGSRLNPDIFSPKAVCSPVGWILTSWHNHVLNYPSHAVNHNRQNARKTAECSSFRKVEQYP